MTNENIVSDTPTINNKLFKLYETHYFHEVDMKEKLLSRVPISFAMLVSLNTLLYYLLSNIKSYNWNEYLFNLLIVFVFLSGLSCLFSMNYFIKSFYGYTYRFLPTVIESEKYRQLLIDTYNDFDNCNELVEIHFKKYLFDAYVDCATINSENNALRSSHFHNTTEFLIPAFTFAIVAAIFFNLSGMNKEKSQEMKVKLINPIEIKKGEAIEKLQTKYGGASLDAKISGTAKTTGTATIKTDSRRVRNCCAWVCNQWEVKEIVNLNENPTKFDQHPKCLETTNK